MINKIVDKVDFEKIIPPIFNKLFYLSVQLKKIKNEGALFNL